MEIPKDKHLDYLEVIESVIADFGRECYPSEIKSLAKFAYQRACQIHGNFAPEDSEIADSANYLLMSHDFFSERKFGKHKQEFSRKPLIL